MTKTKAIALTGGVFVLVMGGILGASSLLASAPASVPTPIKVAPAQTAPPATTPRTFTATPTPTATTPTSPSKALTPAPTPKTYTATTTTSTGTTTTKTITQPKTQPTPSSTTSTPPTSTTTVCTGNACSTTFPAETFTIIPNPTNAQVDAFFNAMYGGLVPVPPVGSPAFEAAKLGLEGKG